MTNKICCLRCLEPGSHQQLEPCSLVVENFGSKLSLSAVLDDKTGMFKYFERFHAFLLQFSCYPLIPKQSKPSMRKEVKEIVRKPCEKGSHGNQSKTILLVPET